MWYVAKTYGNLTPNIVEQFTDEERAKKYADILNAEKGAKYIVLKAV
jgi:hypothetical protein